jgi:hypothetical protein
LLRLVLTDANGWFYQLAFHSRDDPLASICLPRLYGLVQPKIRAVQRFEFRSCSFAAIPDIAGFRLLKIASSQPSITTFDKKKSPEVPDHRSPHDAGFFSYKPFLKSNLLKQSGACDYREIPVILKITASEGIISERQQFQLFRVSLFIVVSGLSARRTERRNRSVPTCRDMRISIPTCRDNEAIESRNK